MKVRFIMNKEDKKRIKEAVIKLSKLRIFIIQYHDDFIEMSVSSNGGIIKSFVIICGDIIFTITEKDIIIKGTGANYKSNEFVLNYNNTKDKFTLFIVSHIITFLRSYAFCENVSFRMGLGQDHPYYKNYIDMANHLSLNC